MALQIWLPLNGNLDNQGVANATITAYGAIANANGKIGQCYSFNNTGHLIGSPAPLSNSTDDWTFACWMKVNTSNNGCLFSNRSRTDLKGITIFYYQSQWIIDDGGRWQFTPTNAIQTNTWYHVCVVRKNGVGKFLYINGTLDSSTPTTTTPKYASPTAFAIGNSQSASTTVTGNQFNGYLNDVRIYDNALSEKEIKDLSRGLVVHYTLSPATPSQLYNEDFTYVDGTPTLSGSVVQFDSPEFLNLESLKISTAPKQSLNGYGHAWPGGANVNKLDLSTATATGAYGLTATYASDGTVTISGTYNNASSNASFRIFNNITRNGIEHFKFFAVSGATNVNSIRWTDTNYNSIATDLINMVDGTAYTIKIKIVGYIGSTAPTSWTPYENKCAITGLSNIWLEHRTKNLWHNDDFIKGSVKKNEDGWYYGTSRNFYDVFRSDNGKYGLFGKSTSLNLPRLTISWDYYTPSGASSGNRLSVYISYADGTTSTYAQCTAQASNGEVVHRTLTSKADKLVSRIYFSYGTSSTIYIKNFQIELGTTATAFEDGEKHQFDVSFTDNAGTVYGCEYDIITGDLTVKHAKITIDNNTTMSANGSTSYDSRFFVTPSPAKKAGVNNMISNLFSYGVSNTYGNIAGRDANGGVEFTLPPSVAQNVADAKAWFAQNPTELVYELDTPITYSLTPQQLSTFSKNTIFSNGILITMTDPRGNALGLNNGIEYDVSGYQRNATLTGTVTPTNNAPMYRNAVQLTGVTGSQRYMAEGLPAETKTISIWMKTTWVNNGSAYKFAVWDKGTQLAIGLLNKALCAYIRISGSTTGTTVNRDGLYLANKWNHIVVVKTGDTTRDVYINGVKAPTIADNYWGSSNYGLIIGCRHYSGYKNYLDGQLSDFRAYVTALSADDVLELYNQGRTT